MKPVLDPILAIEACYAPDVADSAWAKGIVEALRPAAEGAGLYSFALDIRDPARLGWAPLADAGPVPDWRASLAATQHGAPPEIVRAIYRPAPAVDTLSRRLRALPPEVRAAIAGEVGSRMDGMTDCIGMTGAVHDGRWIVVAIPLRPGATPPPRRIHQLRLVAAHLVSGWRLRARLAEWGAEQPDAVLAPDGRVLDAAPALRDERSRGRLADAVRRVERARGALRRTSPEEALSLWQGLVTGRWSLVDRVDADGRRFVLVRRNDPRVRDPKALDEGERQVLAYAVLGHSHKYVGYLLGLAASTVATRLERARAKLGARSRRELIELFAAGGGAAADPPTK
jgi:DNA-binding CsgD family transcriptional regulator